MLMLARGLGAPFSRKMWARIACSQRGMATGSYEKGVIQAPLRPSAWPALLVGVVAGAHHGAHGGVPETHFAGPVSNILKVSGCT